MGAYICVGGCVQLCGWVSTFVWMGARSCVDGTVVWMSAWSCVNGCVVLWMGAYSYVDEYVLA